MTKFKTLTSAATLMLTMAAAPALADVAKWDTNEDGVMSAAEFAGAFAERGVFEVWDVDEDGLISVDEFNIGVYNSIDADGSGDVSHWNTLSIPSARPTIGLMRTLPGMLGTSTAMVLFLPMSSLKVGPTLACLVLGTQTVMVCCLKTSSQRAFSTNMTKTKTASLRSRN